MRFPVWGLRDAPQVSRPAQGHVMKNNLGQYIPIAEPRTFADGADYYEISANEYNIKMHSDLPLTHRLRGYAQTNAVHASSNAQQYLGPMIIAKTFDPTKPAGVNGNGKPVRVKYKNNLPGGSTLPLPVDTTMMGAGLGPDGIHNFTQNRTSIPHLHGGATPWISDGTPQQWLTPAADPNAAAFGALYQKGPSFMNVPDMVNGSVVNGVAVPCIGGAGGVGPCFTPSLTDGIGTLFWSNQQSARLMFYHDHAYGLTRHNVYLGMAAPFLLTDQVEEDMILGSNVSRAFTAPKSVLPNLGGVYKYGIPLVIQDKSFVNDAGTSPGPGFAGTATDHTSVVDPLWVNSAHTWGGCSSSGWRSLVAPRVHAQRGYL